MRKLQYQYLTFLHHWLGIKENTFNDTINNSISDNKFNTT